MKKSIVLFICLILAAALLAGCGAPAVTEPDISAKPQQEDPENTVAAEPDPLTPPQRYVFQPKVCSSYMADVFGETMVEAWYALVDAVMEGKDTFPCPDSYTYNWVMGQFPDQCFPVLTELIDLAWDRNEPVKNGVGSFTYLVPREEAAARIEEFAKLVEDILNSTMTCDSTQVEKALALYLYFSENYEYDYPTADAEGYPDYLSSYRVLTTGTGICQEFSVAYSYLLLQAGVDASVMSGHRSYDNASHQWSYVKINGHDFHVDPTYVLGTSGSLSYFMMDDAQREAEDSYRKEDFVICSHYSKEHPHKEYAASDDSFSKLWGGYFLDIDRESHTIHYEKYDEETNTKLQSFNYTGW